MAWGGGCEVNQEGDHYQQAVEDLLLSFYCLLQWEHASAKSPFPDYIGYFKVYIEIQTKNNTPTT